MTGAIHIGRLRARYRLGDGAEQAKPRLDSALQRALGGALESAVAALGLLETEEICVHGLQAPARLSLDATEEAIAVAWSQALALALGEALASGRGVVRFRSLRHALLDLVVSAARGDLSRSWAWAQLELWDGSIAGTAHLGEALATALCALPEAAPAAVAEAARRGALPALAARLSARDWTTVSRASLRAFGAEASPEESLAPVGAGTAAPVAGEEPIPSSRGAAARLASARDCAQRVAAHSEIIKALPGLELGAAAREALVVLALLEAEPTAAAPRERARAVLGALLSSRGARPAMGARRPGEESRPARTVRVGALAAGDPPRHEVDRDSPPLAFGDQRPPPDRAESMSQGAPIDPRPAGRTRAGGLLYLLPLVAELGLPESLAAEEGPLAARSLRFALHALGLALLPIEPRDPAALAFCGLGPDDAPPGEGAEKPTDAERAALERCAADLSERLRIRLGREREPARAVLFETCRRDAEVLADPGWLEIRFALEDANPRVRRAGLDLDPGWLPWLGRVVRFTYA